MAISLALLLLARADVIADTARLVVIKTQRSDRSAIGFRCHY
jgi:hypothetical protein